MNLNTSKCHKGFTLIELMIVVAIIGILASVALPQYQTYTKRSQFTEVVLATAAFKTAYELGVQVGTLAAKTDADAGLNGMPNATGVVGSFINNITIENGLITATASAAIDSETYTIDPTFNLPVIWTKGGSCIASAVC